MPRPGLGATSPVIESNSGQAAIRAGALGRRTRLRVVWREERGSHTGWSPTRPSPHIGRGG
jgi:hypothetical protein